MIPSLQAAILSYLQNDTTLQAYLASPASISTKIAYAVLPPCYPSVILHVDSEPSDTRAGYLTNGVVDYNTTMAIHVYSRDEGAKIGGVNYDAVSLQAATVNRLGILCRNISTDPTIYAIADIREPAFTSRPLPFEEDTHVHHTSCLFRFTYAVVESL